MAQAPPKTGSVKPAPTGFQTTMMISDLAVQAGSLIFGAQVEDANRRIQNAGAKIQYWTEWQNTNERNYSNYKYQLAQWHGAQHYANQLKGYEAQLATIQSEYKEDVSTAETEKLGEKILDIQAKWYEQEATDDIAVDKIRVDNLVQAAQKKVRNRGKGIAVGRTMVSLDAAQKNQWLQNLGNRQLTTQWRVADTMRQVEAANAAKDSAINQVRLYNPKPINDPVKPEAPLEITGKPPIDTPGGGSALAFQLGSTVLGGIASASEKYDLSKMFSKST